MIAHARDPLPDVAPTDFRGLRVLIFGLGRFGGGAGATRFFAERGARVTVTDRASEEQLGSALEELADLPIERFVLGHHDPEDFLTADWVVVNPAIPPRNELLATAQKGGAELVTEMDLFLWWCPSHFVAGITGTNGKSTTCKLASAMLSESGLPTRLGGNIGCSLLPTVDRISPDTRVVLELSSFQLARLRPVTPRPQVVAITQYAPNHLDWHPNEQHYLESKEQLLRRPREGEGVAVLPHRSPHLNRWRAFAKPRRIVPFDGLSYPAYGYGFESTWLTRIDANGRVDSFLDVSSTHLMGAANRSNLACAAAVAMHLGATSEGVAAAVREYRPLPHRQELLGQHRGIKFINDSKATTPEATLCALEAWAPNIVAIVGGSSKGSDFGDLAYALQGHARDVVLMGDTAQAIGDALSHVAFPSDHVHLTETLAHAFDTATRIAESGDVVLLSPACASFNEFVNYEARGAEFRRLFTAWSET